MEKDYKSPEITDLGKLEDLTLQFKDLTGNDGIVLIPSNQQLGPSGP